MPASYYIIICLLYHYLPPFLTLAGTRQQFRDTLAVMGGDDALEDEILSPLCYESASDYELYSFEPHPLLIQKKLNRGGGH